MDEAHIQRKIQKGLQKDGAYVFKVHGGRYSQGVPDLVGCIGGVFFGLEVKKPTTRTHVSKLQAKNLKDIETAAGIAAVVTSLDEAREVIRLGLEGKKTKERKT